ncbi:MAG: cyclic nucleotide-binding domain-containing protein, partial [Aureibaculum sp.]
MCVYLLSLTSIMFAEYLKTLNNVSPLSEESRSQLLPHISLKKIAQSDFLLKNGDTCRHIYYVNRGFIRIFYYKNGKEITEWFGKEKTFFFSITSYFENIPSKLVIEAVEDSEIILLSKEGTEKLRRSNI